MPLQKHKAGSLTFDELASALSKASVAF